jgi:hypothetical protein
MGNECVTVTSEAIRNEQIGLLFIGRCLFCVFRNGLQI